MSGRALFLSTLPPARVGKASMGFDSRGWSLSLSRPSEILRAFSLDEVVPLVERVEELARSGMYVALALAYEAAPAFDPALATHGPDGLLAWAAACDRAEPGIVSRAGEWTQEGTSPWRPGVDRRDYDRAIHRIRDFIRLGECYQINYTIPFTSRHSGSPEEWFQALARSQGAGFCACLDLGGRSILSLSPELFFLRQGNRLEARPMKGTAPRGRFPREDSQNAAALRASAKDRAENVMIVDLMRNDLGRVADPGSVEAGPMFEIERYPGVLQMTSTVRARAGGQVRLKDIFRAVFPCGSVTGAPKVRAMELIRELERSPRGFYCGAVGFVAPCGDAVFNVPIRTLDLDHGTGEARFHTGGGITYDSMAGAEYEECLTKMRFLHAASGQGDFRLLETMLLRGGRIRLLEYHLDRMRDSADYFGYVFPQEAVDEELGGICGERPEGRHLLRLLCGPSGELECRVRTLAQGRKRSMTVEWARDPVDSSDPMLFHKTDRRGLYDRAQTSRPHADDVVLFNERGEATESCRSNIVARIGGELVTPPVESGLLAGTMRRSLLERNLVRERAILREELERAPFWCVNSVRGWVRARFAEGGSKGFIGIS